MVRDEIRMGVAIRGGCECHRSVVGTLDDSRRPLMRSFGAFVRPAFALTAGILLAAHVGSPDAFYSGMAGPYAVDVVIRAPQVVPGLAEVIVHAPNPRVRRVVVRPVFWRAGTKGAPTGDEARPIEGAPGSYSGKLW